MLSLSDFKYHQGGNIDWIKYAGELNQPPPGAEAPLSTPAAFNSHESPALPHGPISDPALDGGAAAA